MNVEVATDALLARLRTNRDAHRAIFLEAQAKYREAVIVELDKMLDEARAGKRIRRGVSLVEPQDHTGDYDRVIDMFEMSIDKSIVLAEADFARYVRDEWEWRQQFATSTAAYLVTET